jgi:hypothetical protein
MGCRATENIKMLRALFAHPQEVLKTAVYSVRVMSVGCTRIGVEHNTHAIKSASRWFHYTGNYTSRRFGNAARQSPNVTVFR